MGDLEILGKVRIIIIFPVELDQVLYLAVQRKRDLYGVKERLLIQHRERARKPEAYGTGIGVRRLPEFVRAAAERLCLGPELQVDLQPHHRLKLHSFGFLVWKSVDCSNV